MVTAQEHQLPVGFVMHYWALKMAVLTFWRSGHTSPDDVQIPTLSPTLSFQNTMLYIHKDSPTYTLRP
jgi:hypothetical protein